MLIFSEILEHKTEIFLVKRHFRFGKKQRKWKMNEGKIKTFWHVVENVKLRGNRHQTSSSSSNRNEWNPILGSPFLWMNQKQNTEFVKCFYIWLTCKLTNRWAHTKYSLKMFNVSKKFRIKTNKELIKIAISWFLSSMYIAWSLVFWLLSFCI